MYKIMYQVPREETENELDWLRENMVFPATTDIIDFKTGKMFTMIGMIVGNDVALSVKLRHSKLHLQTTWVVGQGSKR